MKKDHKKMLDMATIASFISTDHRVKNAVSTARKHTEGSATLEELNAANKNVSVALQEIRDKCEAVYYEGLDYIYQKFGENCCDKDLFYINKQLELKQRRLEVEHLCVYIAYVCSQDEISKSDAELAIQAAGRLLYFIMLFNSHVCIDDLDLADKFSAVFKNYVAANGN